MVGCIGLPLVVALVYYLVSRSKVESKIRSLEFQARGNGDPVSIDDLIRRYGAIPDTNNAAIPLLALWKTEDPAFWEHAFEADRERPSLVHRKFPDLFPVLGTKWKAASRARPLSEESLALANGFLQEQSNYLAQVHLSVRRGKARFPIVLNDGARALLPHLTKIKEAAQWLKLQSYVRAEEGDIDGAIASLASADRCGAILSDDPTLIGRFVSLACRRIAIDGFTSLLDRGSLTESQLVQIERILASADYNHEITDALAIEAAFWVSLFERPSAMLEIMHEGREADLGSRAVMRLYSASGSDRADVLFYRQSMSALTALSRTNVPALMEALTADKMDDLVDKTRGFPPQLFSQMILPGALGVPKRFCEIEFYRRSLLHAVALERFKRANDEYPEALSLGMTNGLGKASRDPFDGNPLRYRRTAHGYILYSVGADLEDNGGRTILKATDRGVDLVFEIGN